MCIFAIYLFAVTSAAVEGTWRSYREIFVALLSRITFGFMGVTGFLSMWLANIPTTAMMIPIAAAVLKALDDHRMLVREAQRTKRRTRLLSLRR